MAVSPLRTTFLQTHSDVLVLDPGDVASIARHLESRGLAGPDEGPLTVERAGEGNMNMTLRVGLRTRTLILKQGRPWVEKYDQIAAPWDRTLVEGAFYLVVGQVPAVAGRMPRLLDLDPRHHILALEDLGPAADLTRMYTEASIDDARVERLTDWLGELHRLRPAAATRTTFANREMRALNHEHMFRLPLAADNGLDLEAMTPGLSAAAATLTRDPHYVARVTEMGRHYLADGTALVHGDFFPGSWIDGADGVRVIDPEFCFLGAREFDYGVMLAHCALARTSRDSAEVILHAAQREACDATRLFGFAGTEIMRRLIGVAQLPLPYGLGDKRRLLDLSRELVMTKDETLPCWI